MSDPYVKMQTSVGVKERVTRAWGAITDQFHEKGYRADSQLHRVIFVRCREFTRSSGIEISPQAQGLIEVLLSSLLLDPNPHWNATTEDVKKAAWGFVYRLPKILGDISESQKTSYITTFDVLHWLIPQIASILPFTKPP